MRLRVAACQFNPIVGDLEGNTDKILDLYRRLDADGVDVAVFPELAVTGYPTEDLVLKPRFVADNLAALDRLAASTGRCALVVGFVDQDRDLFNAAALCVGGEVALRYRKRILPNYSVFDEYRTFTAGTEALRLVQLHGVKLGITICEDVWSPTGPMLDLAAGGAEVILNLNASPYRAGRIRDRAVMLSTRAADNSCAVVYVNQVGGQDELVFDGGSMIMDHEGHLVTRAPMFAEDVLVCDLEVEPVYRKRRLDPRGSWVPVEPLPVSVLDVAPAPHAGPALVPEPADLPDRLEEMWQALVLGTRDYVTKNGFTEVGVALSGGIDSSIVVALAVEAVGADRVHAVLMPSRYSSEHSVGDSLTLCRNLGVDHRTIPIEPAHAAMLDMLAPSFGDRPADTTEENLQSRIRGMVMMSLSNKLGWLVLTTGNKSETSVGYSTLYGDTAGGFAVIKDVDKLTVYELSRWCNDRAGREIIPEHVLTKPPSAELRPEQRDDQSLPPYEVLDPILDGYVEGDLSASELIERGHDETVVRRIVRLVDLAEYKRRQSPLGIRITGKAFGRDRRVPITNRYRG
jgi:NAD+ synthase (glutamine-hydrolysing)